MNSQAEGTKTTPLGHWKERLEKAMMSSPAATIRVCSLCAQMCTVSHWLWLQDKATQGDRGAGGG